MVTKNSPWDDPIPGTCVATYRVSLSGVQQLLFALEGRSVAGDLGELVANLQQVPAEKVPAEKGVWFEKIWNSEQK